MYFEGHATALSDPDRQARVLPRSCFEPITLNSVRMGTAFLTSLVTARTPRYAQLDTHSLRSVAKLPCSRHTVRLRKPKPTSLRTNGQVDPEALVNHLHTGAGQLGHLVGHLRLPD